MPYEIKKRGVWIFKRRNFHYQNKFVPQKLRIESMKCFKEGNLLFQKLWESLGKEGIVGIEVNK